MRNLSSRKMLSPNGNLRHAETDKMKTLRPYLIWFAVAVLLTIGAIFGMQWVRDHPEHFPGARFELAHPRGWATHGKLLALANDDAACFAAFDRAEAGYLRRPPEIGRASCRERGCQYVEISVVAVSLKKNTNK